MKEAIITESVTKRFGKHTALDGVSLTVHEGELFGLLGVNGAGKTTLIRILCGLLPPDGGHATLLGLDRVEDMDTIKQLLAVSPQETAIAPNLTVAENLSFFAALYFESKAEAAVRVGEVVAMFSLNGVLDKRAKTLSGGWQRRLSIAIALLPRPKILFLDEPTLGLDILARRELWDVIRSLHGETTIVLTSHYLEEMEALCDRVAIMARGKIHSIGTTADIQAAAGTKSFEDAFVAIAKEEL